MATAIWRGDAEAIAQKSTAQVSTYDVTSTYILTVGERVISVIGRVDADTTASDLKDAWTDSTYPETDEATAVVVTDTITFTSATAGVPFAIYSSVTAGTGKINAQSASTILTETVANKGPNDVSVADNWTRGGVSAIPQTGDNVIVENSSSSLLYNLDQSAVTAASTKIKASFTNGATIDLPRINTSGATDYLEYRDTYWKMSSTLCDIGEGEGAGSGRIKLDFGSVLTTTSVFQTGTRAEAAVPTLLLNGSNINNVFAFNRGDIGLGFFGGETCTYLTLRVGYISGVASDAAVIGGDDSPQNAGGVITQTGGILTLSDVIITAGITGGTFTLRETATATTITIHHATYYHETTGLFGALNVAAAGIADFRRNGAARIITDANFYEGASVFDPAETVTWTNPISLVECGYEDVTLQLGKNVTVVTAAI